MVNCPYCQRLFRAWDDLYTHRLLRNHGYSCGVFGVPAERPTEPPTPFDPHILFKVAAAPEGGLSFACFQCESVRTTATFNTLRGVLQHMQLTLDEPRVLKEDSRATTASSFNPADVFKCKNCDRECTTPNALICIDCMEKDLYYRHFRERRLHRNIKYS